MGNMFFIISNRGYRSDFVRDKELGDYVKDLLRIPDHIGPSMEDLWRVIVTPRHPQDPPIGLHPRFAPGGRPIDPDENRWCFTSQPLKPETSFTGPSLGSERRSEGYPFNGSGRFWVQGTDVIPLLSLSRVKCPSNVSTFLRYGFSPVPVGGYW